ncbi:MAG: hypothetical protein ACI4J0_06610 [Huintestinicola sp.]|uniref:hypothetical protein n=1 Tax=Huintestinicola sp. TaxID=2981661 RepID=UPI003EFFBDF9
MNYRDYPEEMLEKFVREQKELSRNMVNEYFGGKLSDIIESCEKNGVREEYGSCAGNTLHRGIYHDGDAFEIAVTNVSRGKKLKKPPLRKDYYRYLFDKEDRLVCSEKYIAGSVKSSLCEKEYIFERDGVKFGLCGDELHINTRLYVSKYSEDRLLYTYTYSALKKPFGGFMTHLEDLCLYDYDENGRKQSVMVFFNFVDHDLHSFFRPDPVLYYYRYDEDGKITGLADESGWFIPSKACGKRTYLTAPKAAEQMEKLISDLNDIPEDVYVLSLYIETNESDGSAELFLGYNTEENCRGSIDGFDDDEARWNYACWLQNDQPLFGEDNRVYIRYIGCGGELRLAASAVKLLHKSGVIARKFGRELPVMIHGLEYYPEIAEHNIAANGRKLIPKGFIEFCGGR